MNRSRWEIYRNQASGWWSIFEVTTLSCDTEDWNSSVWAVWVLVQSCHGRLLSCRMETDQFELPDGECTYTRDIERCLELYRVARWWHTDTSGRLRWENTNVSLLYPSEHCWKLSPSTSKSLFHVSRRSPCDDELSENHRERINICKNRTIYVYYFSIL